jgi:hypothetical protein
MSEGGREAAALQDIVEELHALPFSVVRIAQALEDIAETLVGTAQEQRKQTDLMRELFAELVAHHDWLQISQRPLEPAR